MLQYCNFSSQLYGFIIHQFSDIIRLEPIQFLELVKRQKIQFLGSLWVLALKPPVIVSGKLDVSLILYKSYDLSSGLRTRKFITKEIGKLVADISGVKPDMNV